MRSRRTGRTRQARRRVVRRRRSGPCGHDRRFPRPCRSARPGRRPTGSSPWSQPCAPCACARLRGMRSVLSHASKEPGYRRAAEELGLGPFLQLGMRLGEGSGCPLAFQVLKAACAAHEWHGDVCGGRHQRRLSPSPSARRMRSGWTRHENFTARRQQKRKKRPCAAALRPACRWCTHDLLGDDGAGGRRGPRPHRPPSGRARGLGLQHGRVRPGAGARRTAGEGLRAV